MSLKHLLATAAITLILTSPLLLAQQQASEPPYPPKEPIPPIPHQGWIWEAPYFEWTHKHYEWVKGKWAPPPFPGAVWMPGSWVTKNGVRVWGEAHWKRTL